jgi:hypothetical protein
MKLTSFSALFSFVKIILVLTTLFFSTCVSAQNKTLAIGTPTPNPNAALHVESPTGNQGIIIPRLTTAQRTAMIASLSASDVGLLAFDSDTKNLVVWNGTSWGISIGGTSTGPGAAVFGISSGAAPGGYFEVNNSATSADALFVTTNAALGTSGNFRLTNAANTSPAVFSFTNGQGPAAQFIYNGTGTTSALDVQNLTGTGNAITANGKIQGTQFIGDGSLLTGVSKTLSLGNGNISASPFSLSNNTSGIQNTAIGDGSLFGNTTGTDNVALGRTTLFSNTAGNSNTAAGSGGLSSNTLGTANTAVGYYALHLNTTGSNNVAIGLNALITNGAGNNNTALGSGADLVSGSLVNATVIGSGAIVTASNTMMFGNTSVIGWGFGVSPTGADAIRVGSNGTNGNGASLSIGGTWTNTSDRNKKENFSAVDGKDILQKLTNLNITRWNYKNESPAVTHIGPMAQDFYKMFRVGGDDKSISTIDPSGIALVAIQELSKEIEDLKKMLHEQQALLHLLAEQNLSLKATMAQHNAKKSAGSSK